MDAIAFRGVSHDPLEVIGLHSSRFPDDLLPYGRREIREPGKGGVDREVATPEVFRIGVPFPGHPVSLRGLGQPGSGKAPGGGLSTSRGQ